MPLIGYEEYETRKFYTDHIKELDYNYKMIAFHGFEKEKTTMELADFKNFEIIVKSINVILFEVISRFKHFL